MKLKRISINLVISLMLVAQAPALVLAEEATNPPAPVDTTQAAPADQTTQPANDPAPDPNPAPVTGPSEPNGHIPAWAFNDATGKWDRTQAATFTWNPETGHWNSPLYWYDAKVGWYHVMNSQPAVASTGSVVPALPAQSTNTAAGSANGSDPASVLASLLGGSASNSNTGPYSQNQAGINNNNSTLLQILSDAMINNQNTATSTSGDASISGNTNAGNASTGAASVVANLLNFLNSAWSWSAGGLNTFVQNIFGDHTGDITLQPNVVSGGGGSLGCVSCAGGLGGSASNQSTGPNSTNNADINNQSNLTVDNQPKAAINNNLDLLAQSGNANVSQNTNAGNATTGPATVDLNLLNLINSTIGAGQSFLGLVNIFGNLNGDLLFPAGFLDSVAQGQTNQTGGQTSATNSQTGPGSLNTADINNQSQTNLTNAAQASFNNNIQAGAQSGTAAVRDNTRAGAATTGAAETNTNTHNLFNTGIVGDNAVLVLVNVLGHWVGGIMNLGGGNSSSALLTGNASVSNRETGPNSTNQASLNNNSTTDINNAPQGTITNNIRAGAISGNATVSENTHAGAATTGDAKVATNVVNIFNSALNLKKWFGVLVVNVFGDWTGSVNKDTAAGNAPVNGLAPSSSSGGGNGQTTSTTGRVGNQQVLAGNSNGSGDQVSAAQSSGQTAANSSQTRVLAANSLNQLKKAGQQFPTLLLLGAAITMLVAAGLFRLEKKSRS